MPVLRRRFHGEKPNGLYIHSNPPKILQENSRVKQLIRSGDLDKLEQLVLEGHGNQLLGEYSADYKTRRFLKSVPGMMSKIYLIHDAVNSNKLEELQSLLDEDSDKKRKLVASKDDAGVGLLHKAVYYDLRKIYKFLIQSFPHIAQLKDSEGRTAYHYTPMCKDAKTVQKMLTAAGCDAKLQDNRQHTAKYYATHIQELELPVSPKYFNTFTKNSYKESLNFKKANVRIWIHQKNLGHLQQVVWEGMGSKLLPEHSNNGKIKKFLEAVPHLMGLIRDVHNDVIKGDLEGLQKRTSPPIPNVVLTGKDQNGLTPLHKAAGLGRQDIVEHIIEECPDSINYVDNNLRTPLHYAALLKDGNVMTNFLIDKGADESALDKRQKTAAYYKTRTSELESKFLTVVPECPRSAKESFAANFDWNMLLPPEEPKEDKAEDDKKDLSPTTEVAADDSGMGEEVSENGLVQTEEEPTINEEPEPEEPEVKEPTPVPPNDEENNRCYSANLELQEEEEETQPEEAEPQEEQEAEPQEEQEETTTKSRPTSNVNSLTRPSSKQQSEAEEEVRSRPSTRAQSRPQSQIEEVELEPEGVIEGVVNGEDEVETLNDEGQDQNEEAEDITALVQAGNMEQLAGLVLNGEGDKLVGQTSENQELQSFLSNVPVYMSKINRIHVAAREGSLRDLQAALDRRKFAVAKDPISPNGASPLHVAVVFGNTSVVRYLAGRFPETVQVLDDNGRTPLHYSATLGDNGHYYNLLVHLGADTRIPDKLGHTPDFYRTHRQEFSHNHLLRDFGASEDQLLEDKVPEDRYSARRDLDEEDMLQVLERCYNVLHGRRNSNAVSAASSTSNLNPSNSLLSKHLKRFIFDTIKLRVTKFDHNLYDLIWPSVKKLPTEASFRLALEQDFPTGIVAPDFCVYKVFRELIEPIVKEFNSIDLHFDLGLHPETKFSHNGEESAVDIDLDLDPGLKWIISGTLDCTRNLSIFELPKYMSAGQLEDVERMVTSVLLSDDTAKALYPNATEEEISKNGSGVYYTMNEVLEEPSEARVILASNGLLIPLWNITESDRLHGKHWPYGRGVFIGNGSNLAVWINVLDHIRIVTCTSHTKPGNIGKIYSRVCRLVTILTKHLDFRFDSKLGYLTSRPSALGNTLQFNLSLRFPHLIKEPDNLRHLCVTRNLTYHRNSSTTDVARIGNQQCLGITEIQLFEDFATAVANILQLEKDLAMSNSLHIAAMFVNIFRKKKMVDSY